MVRWIRFASVFVVGSQSDSLAEAGYGWRGLGVGGAAYSVNDTRVGAAVGEFDVAVFLVDHLGVILGARSAVIPVIPRYRHDRLTMVPVLFGLRLR